MIRTNAINQPGSIERFVAHEAHSEEPWLYRFVITRNSIVHLN